MARWFCLIVFLMVAGAAIYRIGFTRGEQATSTRRYSPLCDCECQRTVPIARRRPPQRFDDGRVAPFEATSTRRPLGELPPPPQP